MELDELKKTWTALDEQLKKNVTLNKQILMKMTHKRSNKSLSKLTNTEFIGIIIALLVIPFCIWLYNAFYFKFMLSVKILSVSGIVLSIAGIILSFYKLQYLMRMDFSKNVKESVFCINKYDLIIKKEKIATCFVMLIMTVLGAFYFYEIQVGISMWTFLFVWIALWAVISYWIFKRIYNSHIQSIRNSLEELKELTEE
jgi:uncharacterized protein (DUF983 family)